MNCKKCKAKLENNSIYWNQCGIPTGFVKQHLSAFKTFGEVYNAYKGNMSKHFGISLIIFILSVLPVFTGLYLIKENFNQLSPFLFYAVSLVVLMIFVPFWIIPLSKKGNYLESSSQLSDFFAFIKHYPSALFLCFLSVVYLLLLKVICQGDPILNLVHLVLIIYGLAIMLHVPSLVFEKKMSPLAALKMAYISGKHTIRWQNVFIVMILTLINVPGLLLIRYAEYLTRYNEMSSWIVSIIIFLVASAYLFVAFPLSWQLIKSQYQKYAEQGIFEKNIEKEIA